MIDLPDFLDVGLSDYLVNDLALSYDLTKNKLLARLNLYWLLEIQIKKLNYYYFPDKFQVKGHIMYQVQFMYLVSMILLYLNFCIAQVQIL